MKYIFTMLLSGCFCFSALAANKVFEKLAEVNKCWLEQKNYDVQTLPAFSIKSEKEWIRTHLSLVEKNLRERNTDHLSLAQKQNRYKCLDYLNQYWHEGSFPINDEYTYRTPIFIDKYNNFCAVGYLIKATGNEHISRMIAEKTNLAYVRQMEYPELLAWADQNGFTADELAWIQPAYPPVRHSAPIGKGTDGEIFELYADNTNGKLYVGGSFTMVDSTITANNIAYVTESNGVYTWHNMGTGVNGAVYAIAEYNNNIYVAGAFTEAGGMPVNNVAYWDGTTWHDAGCIFGAVNDLVVYNNQLYAAGHFDVCAALSDVNFAHWNGTMWQQHPGLTGHVNTMEVVDNTLLLGGNFSYGQAKNVIKWDAVNGFQPFLNNLENEVKDFEKFGDTVYAACKRTAASDSSLINKLRNDAWESELIYMPATFPIPANVSFNTLCSHADTFMTGGDFFLMGSLVGNYAYNSYTLINPKNVANWINVDSAINKMVVFKNELIAAGKFKYGNAGFGWSNVALNRIARKSYSPITSVPESGMIVAQLSIYPNPARSGEQLLINNDINADQLQVLDISGRAIASYSIKDRKAVISLPQLSAGIYVIETSNNDGIKATQKLIIQ